jgi:polyhydroxybutyrate depolymerase
MSAGGEGEWGRTVGHRAATGSRWAAGMLAVMLGACRDAPAPARPQLSPAEIEARQLVEKARREVEQGAAGAPAAAPDPIVMPQVLSGRRPFLLFLHGLGGSGEQLAQRLELRAFAELRGFSYMAPDGMLDYAGRRFWNASPSCCNFDGLAVDHVAMVRDWILEAVKRPGVDPARVYVVGYSNGGFMAYRAACELGDLIRGIVSIAGAGPNDTATCKPMRALSVVEIHGDADPIVAFDGGYLFADRSRPKHPSAEKSLLHWAKYDGCSEPFASVRTLDIDPRTPGAETEVFAYPGCGKNHVELWRIHGGDHSSGISHRSMDAIWHFIEADSGS